MFSADLAYATNFDEEDWGSPPSYLASQNTMVHPWRRSLEPGALDNDFILIAEFSELEGPRPVVTIPKDGAGSFDLSEFAVRIMSIDQNTFVSGGFHMSEDSQVILCDSCQSLYAFVHHFVLFDKQARGYVRPFAISYVTNDQRKLLCCYQGISVHLRKVAKYFKYANRMVFRNELDRYLMDLEYTKAQELPHYRSVMSQARTNTDSYEKELLQNLKTLETIIFEVKSILNTICATLNDKRLEQRFLRMEERRSTDLQKTKTDSTADSEKESNWSAMLFFDSQTYKPKRIQIGENRKFDLHLRGLRELCSLGAKEGLQKLHSVQQHFQRDLSYLQLDNKEISHREPSAGALTFGSDFVAINFMSDIDKVCVGSFCGEYQRARIDQSKVLARWSSNETLESFKSVASSFKSVGEGDDSMSLLSVSSVPESFSSYRDLDIRNGKFGEDSEYGSVSSSLQCDACQNLQKMDLNLDNKCRPENETNAHEDNCNTDKSSADFEASLETPTNADKSILRDSRSNTVTCNSELRDNSQSVQYPSNEGGATLCEDNAAVMCTCGPGDGNVLIESEGRLLCPVHGDAGIQEFLRTGHIGAIEEKKSLNLDEDFIVINGAEDDIFPLCQRSENLETSGNTKSSAQCLDKVLNSYNNIHHIVYSLLSGRPVLVIGSSVYESQVKDAVRGLKHFAPSCKDGCIQHWSTQLPQMSDLSKIKLLGICRPEKKSLDRWLTSSIKRYVSILDVERKCISAPTYHGSFLTQFMQKRKSFRSEPGAMLSFVKEFLSEVASKSFIFFHLFCMGNAGTFTSGYTLPTQSKAIKQTVTAFLTRLGALEGDAVIVQYLAEVVKQQYIDNNYKSAEDTAKPVGPLVLREQTCQSLRC